MSDVDNWTPLHLNHAEQVEMDAFDELEEARMDEVRAYGTPLIERAAARTADALAAHARALDACVAQWDRFLPWFKLLAPEKAEDLEDFTQFQRELRIQKRKCLLELDSRNVPRPDGIEFD